MKYINKNEKLPVILRGACAFKICWIVTSWSQDTHAWFIALIALYRNKFVNCRIAELEKSMGMSHGPPLNWLHSLLVFGLLVLLL